MKPRALESGPHYIDINVCKIYHQVFGNYSVVFWCVLLIFMFFDTEGQCYIIVFYFQLICWVTQSDHLSTLLLYIFQDVRIHEGNI